MEKALWCEVCITLSGESADVREEDVADWSKRLSTVCAGYEMCVQHFQCKRNRIVLSYTSKQIYGAERWPMSGEEEWKGQGHCSLGCDCDR